ncbi:hypothetical protein LINPERHAP2_LOCUS13091 [Linum perenne]
MQLIHGDDEKQFAQLYNYKLELEATNPGSTIVIVHQGLVFERIYICLDALKRGFKAGCRQVVCIDGCFLRGVPGWQLLSAVGIDANDCMYPIAWAVVESETQDTWEWFVALLGIDLEIRNNSSWTFMSDRQKGLINALNTLYPHAEHRFCVRHMYVNFSGKFGRAKYLKDLVWGAARSTYETEFQSWMNLMEKEGLKYQPDKPNPHKNQWCKAFFRTETKCEVALNNMCECWNKYILDPRGLPILSCLEQIRCLMMQRICRKMAEMARLQGNLLCPKPQKKLDEYKKQVRFCTPTYNGAREFQVKAAQGKIFVVDLSKRTCACGH